MTVRTDILPDALLETTETEVQRIVGNYVADLHNDRRTRAQIPPGSRMRQPKPALDIDSLPNLIADSLDDKQETEGVPPKLRVGLIEDFPPGFAATEVITYGLFSRDPASMSQGRHQNQKRQEWKPSVRGIEDDNTKPGSKVIIFGQKYENELIYTCWAKTNKTANKRARWFEDLMKEYAWYIKYNGIDEFYMIKQESDIELKLDGTEHILHGRPFRFFARTERLTVAQEPTIRRLLIRLGVTDDISDN
jgi:hypothetical protein